MSQRKPDFSCSAWLARTAFVAPTAPTWLRVGVAKTMANDAVRSDGLLLVADMLADAADEAAMGCNAFLSRDIGRLAELCRVVAAQRAVAG